MSEISSQSWVSLYHLASRFKQMAPWRWMNDSDLFGIENPHSKEVGFCCIMGRLGEFFGMAVYKGRAGLYSYEKLLESDPDEMPKLQAFEQNCLMLGFDQWEELTEIEQERIETLGIKADADGEWPSFRDYSPAMMPWIIETAEQVFYLEKAIEQALELCPRILHDAAFLEAPSELKNPFLVRRKQENKWENEWLEVESYRPAAISVSIDRRSLREEIGMLPKAQISWCLDYFFVPVATQHEEGGRPFFPKMLVIAQQGGGHIIGHGMFGPDELEQELQSFFTKVAVQERCLPESVIVCRYESLELLEQLASSLNIPLELEEGNAVLEDIKRSLLDSMSSR